MELHYKYQVAELLLRLLCGIIFLFQGYDKLFNVKISGVVATFEANAQRKNIPYGLLKAVAIYTSYAEFLGGAFLIVGLFTNISILVLMSDLVIAGLAFSIMEPVWNMRHVFPRMIFLVILLALPENWNLFGLDYFIKSLINK